MNSSTPLTGEPARDQTRIKVLVARGEGTARTMASCAQEGFDAEVIAEPGDPTRVDLADCDWVLPVLAGDTLALGSGAAYRVAASTCEDGTCVIYADDDMIESNQPPTAPHLKPDWNSELFQHFDYVAGAALLRASALDFAATNDEDWAASLTKQAIAQGDSQGAEPLHLRRVLHHRSARPAPQLPLASLPAAPPNTIWPCVSVIIPTRNRVDLLRVCLKGLLKTDYPGKLDVIVIDNGSDDLDTCEYLAALDEDFARVLRDDGPFNFAALNNRAVSRAQGEMLCFLNNDIEIRDPDWLTVMVQQAQREEVGAVGARLLYPDGLIQHAGVVIGIGGAAAHAHRGLDPDEQGYFYRHSLPQFVSAVTAACMVIRRDRFEAVAGFDEERFAVSFNDVDLCLRLGQKGWRCLYEPRATLVHHESVSRGLDRDDDGAARQAREVAALQDRWNTQVASAGKTRDGKDPFHHPELSPLSEQFVLRL